MFIFYRIICVLFGISQITFFFNFILFLERGGGRERETSVCGCLSHAPKWGPGLQPRHVPWLRIELATLWFSARTQTTELHQPGREMLEILLPMFSSRNFMVLSLTFKSLINFTFMFMCGVTRWSSFIF